MSRCLLNIQKVFFPLLRPILFLDGDGFSNRLAANRARERERKPALRSAPLDFWVDRKKNEITETRRESMSQDRKVFDSSSLFRAHSKMSARRADESRSGERPINQLADRRDLPSCCFSHHTDDSDSSALTMLEALLEPSTEQQTILLACAMLRGFYFGSVAEGHRARRNKFYLMSVRNDLPSLCEEASGWLSLNARWQRRMFINWIIRQRSW